LRVVLDTNVIVSSYVSPRGAPGRIREALSELRFELVLSQQVLDEYRHVLHRPGLARFHGMTAEKIEDQLAKLVAAVRVELATSIESLPVRDPNDAIILEAAVAGGANLIVSGDNDLLVLGTFRGIGIVSPTAFLALLGL